MDITVRCTSCCAKNEIEIADVDAGRNEAYGEPHYELQVYEAFSCCDCGKRHVAGYNVPLEDA